MIQSVDFQSVAIGTKRLKWMRFCATILQAIPPPTDPATKRATSEIDKLSKPVIKIRAMSVAVNWISLSKKNPSYPLPGILKHNTVARSVSIALAEPTMGSHQPLSPVRLELAVSAWPTKISGADPRGLPKTS